MADIDESRGNGEGDEREHPETAYEKWARELMRSRERANLVCAMAHPVRRCVLRALGESEESHSPTWLAKTLDIPLSTTAYHVTILRKFGAIELADEQAARGAVEHFYTTTIEDDPPIEALLEETREADESDDEAQGGDA
jgi:DNA-binding transcriptional ArsR family regulator